MIRVQHLKHWLSVAACSVTVGCAGRVANDASAPDPGATTPGATTPGAATPGATEPSAQAGDAAEEIYGAAFEGDAGQCANVICNGSQVCCVVAIESDASTPHPNNKCDYDCVARCMDSCPAVTLGQTGGGSAAVFDGGHGGGIVLPEGDASEGE